MSNNPFFSTRTPYFCWLNSALCSLATFHRHQLNRIIICDKCQINLSSRNRVYYDSITRHRLVIGKDKESIRCSFCSTLISYPETAVACAKCYEALTDLARQLYISENKPYLRSEATVIEIEETRACPFSEE